MASSAPVLKMRPSNEQQGMASRLATQRLDSARRAGVTHVVASSFVYDTFARGSRLANQKPYVYQRHERYQELFEYPYQEFAPTHAALGWSNPTIRIIDIRKAPPPGRP